MNHTTQNTYYHTLPQLTTWKQKINFLDALPTQILKQQLPFSPQLLQNHWPTLITDHNLNVLSKALIALKLWVKNYEIRSLRVQKQLIRTLISLSKMGRPEIDSNVISIVISLMNRQKQLASNTSRIPLSILGESQFNSHNNPTFLVGLEQSATIQEVQIQKPYQITQTLSFSPRSLLLGQILDALRSCQKHSFLICLKIIDRIAKQGLLSRQEFGQLLREVQRINGVIQHRKSANPAKDKQIDDQTSILLSELSQVQI